jgi:hypothetical protein
MKNNINPPALVRPAEDLDARATRINGLLAAADDKTRSGLEDYRLAGAEMALVKQHVGHGNWLQWVEENLHCNARQAQKYMRLHRKWDELKSASDAHLSIDAAQRVLAAEDEDGDQRPGGTLRNVSDPADNRPPAKPVPVNVQSPPSTPQGPPARVYTGSNVPRTATLPGPFSERIESALQEAEIDRKADDNPQRVKAEALARLDPKSRELLKGSKVSIYDLDKLFRVPFPEVRHAIASLLRSAKVVSFAAALERLQVLGAQKLLARVAEEEEELIDETGPEPESGARKVRGKGIFLAHEAINSLIRIPKNDTLRRRGFQLVTDWIERNP